MHVCVRVVMFPGIQTQFLNLSVIQESNCGVCVCFCLYVSINTKTFHLSICDLRYYCMSVCL